MGGGQRGSSVTELPRAPEPHKTLGVRGGSPQSPMQGPAWVKRPGLFSLGVGRAGLRRGPDLASVSYAAAQLAFSGTRL